MDKGLKIKLYAVTIDCKNPDSLARFYAELLDWEIAYSGGDFVCIGAPGTPQGGYVGLTFQKNPDYKPPVWPEKAGEQQQMEHLDLAVNDLEGAVKRALECGAKVAENQFSDSWTVMFDPEGHPFCLCVMAEIMQSQSFALK